MIERDLVAIERIAVLRQSHHGGIRNEPAPRLQIVTRADREMRGRIDLRIPVDRQPRNRITHAARVEDDLCRVFRKLRRRRVARSARRTAARAGCGHGGAARVRVEAAQLSVGRTFDVKRDGLVGMRVARSARGGQREHRQRDHALVRWSGRRSIRRGRHAVAGGVDDVEIAQIVGGQRGINLWRQLDLVRRTFRGRRDRPGVSVVGRRVRASAERRREYTKWQYVLFHDAVSSLARGGTGAK